MQNTKKVHNVPVKPGYQKFIISSVFIQRADLWDEFDADRHCRGAYIQWNLAQAKPTKAPVSIPLTPASNPQTEFTEVKESERGRKRKRNEDNWEQKRKKRARDCGQSYSPYKSYKARKRSSERTMQEPCNNCRQECSSRISDIEREKLFTSYWGLKNAEKQRQFISNSVKCIEPKRNRGRSEDKSRQRTKTILYFLEDTQVCQTMFLNTYNISRKVVRTAIEKRSQGNIVTEDLRGKKQSHIKYDEETVNKIKSHIKSFPVMESHYSRESSKRQYLASNLNVRKMYELFIKEHSDVKVEEHFYRKIFSDSFNLGFHQPKKDQCDICIEYKNAIDKSKLEKKYQEHQKNKNTARNLKTKMKDIASKQKSLVVAAFDLQKVLSVPYGEHSDFFYKRKLAVYDLTITNLDTREVYCYVWDQTIAKRGSNEIASCLRKFLNGLPNDCKEVFFFADNCGGQNKNRFINEMLSIAATEQKIKINLIFLEKGHTQNINDTAHSVIEKAKSGVNIHHPHQWITLIESACRKKPYNVFPMCQDEFFNFKTELSGVFYPLISKKTQDKNGKNVKVSWSKIKQAQFMPSTDGVLYMDFKYNLDDDFTSVIIGRLQRKLRCSEANSLKAPRLYEDRLPVTHALKKVIHKKFNNLPYRPFLRRPLLALFLGTRRNKGRRKGVIFICGQAVMENLRAGVKRADKLF